ncbi:hypothetical protein NUW54_g2895 [Trametes sanguinea]|uniref:Uncharacterized protein n=1 Tax=Trametes sanguinea TaxID=158606 RepID=A0ACC1Q602_9APHY|nr:hypothetical protein NUW54_g2895 [Trametes sanguinea]
MFSFLALILFALLGRSVHAGPLTSIAHDTSLSLPVSELNVADVHVVTASSEAHSHLGPFSYPVAIISCVWIAFISIAFHPPAGEPGRLADAQLHDRRRRDRARGPIKQITDDEAAADSVDAASSAEVPPGGKDE